MPGRSSRRNRDSGVQRESSSSGSRPHRHRSSNSYRSRRFRLKHKERNFIAAVCSMIVIVILCTALAESKWISLSGGGCNLSYIGACQFFFNGFFETSFKSFTPQKSQNLPIQYSQSTDEIYHYGSGRIMKNCVTPKAVALMKTIIGFIFFAILCSFFAFLLDLIGPLRRSLKLIRRNAFLSILTVVICVVVNGFTYWVTTEIEKLQRRTKIKMGSKVEVDFDVSFYLVAAAGGVAVLATASNCLRRYPIYEESQTESLLDDYDGVEALLPPGPEASALAQMPPPPAYSP